MASYRINITDSELATLARYCIHDPALRKFWAKAIMQGWESQLLTSTMQEMTKPHVIGASDMQESAFWARVGVPGYIPTDDDKRQMDVYMTARAKMLTGVSTGRIEIDNEDI